MSRVQRIMARANSRLSVQLAATLLASSSLVASVLGLLRDTLMNRYYYHTLPNYADAYTVAFIIPDFMFFVLTTGALSVSFIPVFNDRLQSGNRKSAWELSTSLVNLLALVTLVSSLLIIIFADPLVRYVVGPGLDEVGRGLAVSMMRVIAINPFLFAIASVIASVQQAVGRFVFFALSPVIYNLGIIIGILFFSNGISVFGIELFEGGIMGVALGVVLGSILQLVVSAVGLAGLGFDYDFKIHWKNKGFRQVLSLLPARSFDQGIDYFNSIVETNLASRMVNGSVRAYNQAFTLHSMPVNLIGVAISTAAFPQMTERLSQGRPDLFRSELQAVLRIIVWLALPIATIAFFTQDYLTAFLFGKEVPVVATTLGILCIAIVFRSVYHIASRSFYAQKDTKTPLYISIFTITLNIVLAVIFSMQLNMGIYGLALAQSITAVAEVCLLFRMMSKTGANIFSPKFLGVLMKISLATLIMSAVTVFTVALIGPALSSDSFWSLSWKFLVITFISSVSYLFISRAVGLKEADRVIKIVKQRAVKLAFGQIRQRSDGER